MRRFILLIALLALPMWAMAQYDSGSQTGTTQNNTMQTSIQGCLSSSGGQYMLTDQSGTIYQLTGNTENLSAHVGHTIKVMGMASSNSSTPGSMSSGDSQNNPSQQFEVKSFRHIASSCKQ